MSTPASSSAPTKPSQESQTVRDLRRRWKPHKERLNEIQADHPSSIRIHRAFSWLQHVEETEGEDDLALLSMRIAFNAPMENGILKAGSLMEIESAGELVSYRWDGERSLLDSGLLRVPAKR